MSIPKLYLQDHVLHLEAILLSGPLPHLRLSKMWSLGAVLGLPAMYEGRAHDPTLSENHTQLQNKPGRCHTQHSNHSRDWVNEPFLGFIKWSPWLL